jgi:hypothetical protein
MCNVAPSKEDGTVGVYGRLLGLFTQNCVMIDIETPVEEVLQLAEGDGDLRCVVHNTQPQATFAR